MSKPSLLTDLHGWWEFEEDFDQGHTAMDKSAKLNHIQTWGEQGYGNRFAKRASGKIGYGISPRYVYTPSNTDFNLHADIEDGGYSISAWFKTSDPTEFGYIASKIPVPAAAATEYEYELYYNGTGEFTFVHYYATGSDTVNSTFPGELEPDTWYFVCAWVDPTQTKVYIQVNDETPDEVALTGATFTAKTNPFRVGEVADPGTDAPFIIDNLCIWLRTLTDDERLWLYNDGAGRSYSEIDPTATEDCRAITCCEPEQLVADYAAESATSSGAGSGTADPCTEVASVTFDPPCGSFCIFPILVTITSNYADATIYYTTDGSTPTEASDVYSAPISVAGPSVTIKAYASPATCPDGVVQYCSWNNYEDVPILFQVYCSTSADHVGAWDDWGANGTNDINWYFAITPSANLDVTRFEIYQCDSTLVWTTGAAWATDSPIVPELPWDQTQEFEVYPLEFDEVGIGVVHSSYQDDWGTITAGAHDYVLYGEPIIALSGVFKMIMVLASGQRIYATIPYTSCDDPPPPVECPFPVITSITSGCKQLTVTFDVTAPDRNYRFYYKRVTAATWLAGPTGFDSGSGLTETITGLEDGVTYILYVEQELTEGAYDHCEDWTKSNYAIRGTNRASTVSISASETEVESGGSVVITVTSANIPAGGSVAVTNDQGLAGVACGATPWAATPNSTVTCTFTLTATTTWTATVSGGCTNPTDEVTVEVVAPPGACDSSWVLAHPTLEVYTSLGRPPPLIFPPCTNIDPLLECEAAPPGTAEWDGTVWNSTSVIGQCHWHTGPSIGNIYTVAMGSEDTFACRASVQVFLDDAECWGGAAGTNWWIVLVACQSHGEIAGVKQLRIMYAGYKDTGQTPVGDYTVIPGLPECLGANVPCDQAELFIKVRVPS